MISARGGSAGARQAVATHGKAASQLCGRRCGTARTLWIRDNRAILPRAWCRRKGRGSPGPVYPDSEQRPLFRLRRLILANHEQSTMRATPLGAPRRCAARGGLAVADQAVVAGRSFAVSTLLARWLTPTQ